MYLCLKSSNNKLISITKISIIISSKVSAKKSVIFLSDILGTEYL